MLRHIEVPYTSQAHLPAGLNPQRISDRSRDLLNHLRLSAMGCRVAARTDLFEACALLTLEGEDAKRTFVATLVKCLPDAVNKPIKWFQPGASELSFDEAWVMRCLASIEDNDTSSLAFLLRSRIAAPDRRYIGYLLGRISEQFPQV
ncbi:hypothetical protein GGR95_002804 [Sulfitobacter undariae]|uniref:Uncharacterized protein n=2 Tax=Sulfitobacter undariae TaxID=1563671 RepID=A0A7W6E5J7_9RHOB|nr:hypothetical protein [Sulfitobacter undariae]